MPRQDPAAHPNPDHNTDTSRQESGFLPLAGCEPVGAADEDLLDRTAAALERNRLNDSTHKTRRNLLSCVDQWASHHGLASHALTDEEVAAFTLARHRGGVSRSTLRQELTALDAHDRMHGSALRTNRARLLLARLPSPPQSALAPVYPVAALEAMASLSVGTYPEAAPRNQLDTDHRLGLYLLGRAAGGLAAAQRNLVGWPDIVVRADAVVITVPPWRTAPGRTLALPSRPGKLFDPVRCLNRVLANREADSAKWVHNPPLGDWGAVRTAVTALGVNTVADLPRELSPQHLVDLAPGWVRWLRDRALLCGLYGAAARMHELLAVRVDDLVADDSGYRARLTAPSKADRFGDGLRELRFPRTGGVLDPAAAIDDWLAVTGGATGLLLPGGRPGGWVGGPRRRWAPGRAVRVLREMAEAAGLATHIAAHTPRRTAATVMYLAVRDIEAVRRLLGHTSLDSTKRYIAATNSDSSAGEIVAMTVAQWMEDPEQEREFLRRNQPGRGARFDRSSPADLLDDVAARLRSVSPETAALRRRAMAAYGRYRQAVGVEGSVKGSVQDLRRFAGFLADGGVRGHHLEWLRAWIGTRTDAEQAALLPVLRTLRPGFLRAVAKRRAPSFPVALSPGELQALAAVPVDASVMARWAWALLRCRLAAHDGWRGRSTGVRLAQFSATDDGVVFRSRGGWVELVEESDDPMLSVRGALEWVESAEPRWQTPTALWNTGRGFGASWVALYATAGLALEAVRWIRVVAEARAARDRAFVVTGYRTAMVMRSLAELAWADADRLAALDDEGRPVPGPDGDWEFPTVREALGAWAAAWPWPRLEGPLFPPLDPRRLTTEGPPRLGLGGKGRAGLLARLARQAGVSNAVTPKLLRTSRTWHVWSGTGDELRVNLLLNHVTSEATKKALDRIDPFRKSLSKDRNAADTENGNS